MGSSTLSLSLCLLALLGAAAAQGDWKTGRATFYGIDGWSIHKGACGFGYQYKNLGTGWDVAAIADASPEFSGSCGRCYEVRCEPRSSVKDGYGNSFDRSGACKAGSASVVVRTVDNCPCVYPGNPYSNKRWCCGDNSDTQGTHFDLSIWAFEKIADVKLGMAAIQYRQVPCSQKPSNPAPTPAGSTPMPSFEQPKALGYPGSAEDPGTDIYQQKFVQRFDDTGAKQGAIRPHAEYDGSGQSVTLGEVLNKQGGSSGSSSSDSNNKGSDNKGDTKTSSSSSDGGDNGCTDVAPSGSTCQEQKDKKQCEQPWLLKGNYCRATCGRCQPSGSSSSTKDQQKGQRAKDQGKGQQKDQQKEQQSTQKDQKKSDKKKDENKDVKAFSGSSSG